MIRIKIRKEIDRKKYLLFAILSFVIVLAAWLIASESGAIKEIFLPKPQNVVNYYIESIKDGSLLQNTGISIYRITLGFVYAVLLGVPIGILVGTFKKAEAFIRPLCEFVRICRFRHLYLLSWYGWESKKVRRSRSFLSVHFSSLY